MMNEESKTAFITGATSGIGAAFAKELSRQGYDLIITGRRKEKIESLAEQLRNRNCREIEVVVAELSNRETLDSLAAKIRAIDDLEFLVNNAGFATYGEFHKIPDAEHEKMLNVHSLAVMRLTRAALPKMVQTGTGALINVSSLSAFTPFPYNAMYSATKSFINYFTESLYLELLGTGVKVQALCPGMTRTDFHEKMGLDPKQLYESKGLMKAMLPEEVVRISLQALDKGKVICVPGFHNKTMAFLTSVLPRRMLYKMMLSKFSRD